jgi:hypothetical protein
VNLRRRSGGRLVGNVPLPIPREIHRLAALHRQSGLVSVIVRLHPNIGRNLPLLRQLDKDVVWFALNEDRPPFAFAGIWTEFKGERGTKSKPIPRPTHQRRRAGRWRPHQGVDDLAATPLASCRSRLAWARCLSFLTSAAPMISSLIAFRRARSGGWASCTSLSTLRAVGRISHLRTVTSKGYLRLKLPNRRGISERQAKTAVSPAAMRRSTSACIPAVSTSRTYPTASQVPALAVNTTVAMKITVSIRDKVHALGIGNGLRTHSWGCGQPVYKLWMTLE